MSLKRIKAILKIFIYDENIFIINSNYLLCYKTYAIVWLKKGNATFFISFFKFYFFYSFLFQFNTLFLKTFNYYQKQKLHTIHRDEI